MLGVETQEFIFIREAERSRGGPKGGPIMGPIGEPRGCRGEADVPRGQGAEG